VEYWQPHGTSEFADGDEPGRDRGSHTRHVVGRECALCIHTAVDGVEEVEHAGALEQPSHLNALLEGESGFITFIDHIAYADDELVAGLAADLLQHHQTETAAVLPRAAKTIGAPVGLGREELADEMPAGEHFDSVKAAVAATAGRRPVRLHHAADIMLVHFLWEAAV